VIARIDAVTRHESLPLQTAPLEVFGDMVIGELLVNALVVVGSAFFFLPGIYIGLRSVYYKQIIVLHKARPIDAIRESFRLTRSPREVFRIFLLLAASYSLPLAIEYMLTPMTEAWWIHPIGVFVSTTFIAWINIYITLSFCDVASSQAASQRAV